MKTIFTSMTAFCILLVLLVSCSRQVEGDGVTLQFDSNDAVKSDSVNVSFNEEDCIVLRCSSFTSNEREIVAKVSKSKDLKAITLVFVKLNKSATNAKYVQIAVVPITGKEYEYDIAQARFYHVTPSSAEAAVDTYGIPYSDWQYGAVNNSEKFPCCE
jgi:hypothetical protein